jgi:hypothetical protein
MEIDPKHLGGVPPEGRRFLNAFVNWREEYLKKNPADAPVVRRFEIVDGVGWRVHRLGPGQRFELRDHSPHANLPIVVQRATAVAAPLDADPCCWWCEEDGIWVCCIEC